MEILMSIADYLGGYQEPQKREAEFIKCCNICDSKMKSDNGTSYCNTCNEKGLHHEASYWKDYFAKKKANILNPQMQKLAEAFRINNQPKPTHHLEAPTKSINDILQANAEHTKNDLTLVKNQVHSLLPSVLAQFGVQNKLDADLVVDILVPKLIKTAMPNKIEMQNLLKNLVADLIVKQFPNLLPKAMQIKSNKVPVIDTVSKNIIHDEIRNYSGKRHIPVRSINDIIIAQAEHDHQYEHGTSFNPDDIVEVENDSHNVDVANSESLHDNIPDQKEIQNALSTLMQVLNADADPQNPLGDGRLSSAHLNNAQIRNPKYNPDTTIKNKAFHYRNDINKIFPVELVPMQEVDRKIITANMPLETFTARYNNGKTSQWDCYKTNKGYLALSGKASYHAKDLQSFAQFLQANDGFTGWDHAPEEIIHPHIDEEMIEEVPDEQLEDQFSPETNEEALIGLIMELLPHIEEMFPDEPEECENIAMTAALNALEGNIIQNADSHPLLHELSKHVNNGIDSLISKNPHLKPLMQYVQPYVGVSDEKNQSGPGNALFHDVENGATQLWDKAIQPAPNAKPNQKTNPKSTPSSSSNQNTTLLPNPTPINNQTNHTKNNSTQPSKTVPIQNSTNKILPNSVPYEKKNQIKQVVSQLHLVKNEIDCANLLTSLHRITAHLDNTARKNLLPEGLHEFYDIYLVAMEEEAKLHKNENEEDDQENDDDKVEEIHKITAELNQNEFSLAIEALLQMGYNENDIMQVAERRFTTKEHREIQHIKDSEEKSGKSPEEAEHIGYGTVQNQKKED